MMFFSGFPSNDVFTDDRFLSLREVYEQWKSASHLQQSEIRPRKFQVELKSHNTRDTVHFDHYARKFNGPK